MENPELLQQINGLDAMLDSALTAAQAPKPLFDAWNKFIALTKKFASGEQIEDDAAANFATALTPQTFEKIQPLINKFRRMLPEPFVLELESILTKPE